MSRHKENRVTFKVAKLRRQNRNGPKPGPKLMPSRLEAGQYQTVWPYVWIKSSPIFPKSVQKVATPIFISPNKLYPELYKIAQSGHADTKLHLTCRFANALAINYRHLRKIDRSFARPAAFVDTSSYVASHHSHYEAHLCAVCMAIVLICPWIQCQAAGLPTMANEQSISLRCLCYQLNEVHDFHEKRSVQFGSYQCDQMATLFVQFLASKNN